MAEPKEALSQSEIAACTAQVSFTSVTPVYDESFDGEGESFAPHHYEQVMAAVGTITVGTRIYHVNGHGLRDHSWGPRSWQALWFYRWVHGSSAGLSFMGAYFGSPNGGSLQGGFVMDGDQFVRCDTVVLSTNRDERDQQKVTTVRLSGGGRQWEFVGKVESNAPLRHRRHSPTAEASTTRIVEGSTRWTCSDGRELHGMTEYLDQMTDAGPVGIAV